LPQLLLSAALSDFYEGGASPRVPFDSTLVSQNFMNSISAKKGTAASILSLQAAMSVAGLFRVDSSKGCVLDGRYNYCTTKAVSLFQKMNGLPSTGQVLGKTKTILKEFFASD